MLVNWCLAFALLTLAVGRAACGLGAELGSRPKRRPSENDHSRVTIDLSALRPSLPGLVLYKYGDLAPKLVQVDLSALNPRIQPHVIWPQFSEMEFDDDARPFELDGGDAIPYLTEEDMSPRRMAKMTEEWMRGAGDMYDFVQDGDQDRLLSLHGSLPLADEVIVPLDWEEGEGKKKKQKKNVFLTRGWRAGGERGSGASQQKQQSAYPKLGKGMTSNFNGYYSRGGISRASPGWSTPRRRETESEGIRKSSSKGHPGKKDARTSSVLTRDGQDAQPEVPPVRISSQESWSVPRQYWNVPHLFVNNWQ